MDNKNKLIIATAIILAVFLILVAALTIPMKIDRTTLVINRGDSAIRIADKLKDKGLIRYPFLFKLASAITGNDKNLKPGRYIFEVESNAFIALDKICTGDYELIHVTIPEGLSLTKTLSIVASSLDLSFEEMKNLATNPLFCKSLTGLEIDTLEGFLYPETYHFEESTSVSQALRVMVNLAKKKFNEVGIGSIEQLNYYETVNLASIVELEAKDSSEMPVIADVYLKRLRKGIKLGASPTVQYLLEKKGKRRKFLYYKDTEIESPYNTYLNYGLPPTPICSPSARAVEAVISPADTDFLYFFADGSGKHIFTKSYKEHLNMRKKHKMNGSK